MARSVQVTDIRLRDKFNEVYMQEEYRYLSWVYGGDRKSVTRVTDGHHEACQVMPNSDPE